jgi:hypothetical protein
MFGREGYFSAKLVDTTYMIKSFDELGEREILALAIRRLYKKRPRSRCASFLSNLLTQKRVTGIFWLSR